MPPHREVEIKFVVPDTAALARRLRAAGFRRTSPRQLEINTLYDLPSRQLRRRGEILRLRSYGRVWTLTHKNKGSAGRHKTRVETETEIADGTRMDGILRSMGFTPVIRYEKYRAVWSDRHGQVAVDETPIGCFAEIEGQPVWIERTARALRVQAKDYITATYLGLFASWKQQNRSRAREMTFRELGVRPARG